MTASITGISALLTLLVAIYLVRQQEAAQPTGLSSSVKDNLLTQKNKLIADLREIELDLKTEKLSADDYERLKLQIHKELSGLLKELDQHV